MTTATEPTPLSTTITPSGIEIAYYVEPKRKYELRQPDLRVKLENDGEFYSVAREWREVPSVTTVLEVLDKPALPWWGMKVGIEGSLAMLQMGLLSVHDALNINGARTPVVMGESGRHVVAGSEQVIELLTKHKLTVNHVRDKAGVRGQGVHDALEVWANEGIMPDPQMFPPEEQGYVAGLAEFLRDVEPEPVASEVMVGSIAYGFAGRYDIRWRIPRECNVVYKRTPKRGAHYATLPPGLLLGDLKTSKGIYFSHSRQLEAYELASVECGYEPTMARGILHVTADGHYEFSRSIAEADDFLCVLEVWRSEQRMKERKR